MLLNPKQFLVRARREGWAMGGFNIFNLESARAVIDAAEELAAPLLVQTSEGAVKHAGMENIVAIVRQLAGRTKAPVALHLDHGKSVELTRAAVDAGYTSVMIDASRESFDENVRETRDIVVYAHARGVHVEAELGTLGGIEDLGEQSGRSMLTDPDQAVRFAAATEVDAPVASFWVIAYFVLALKRVYGGSWADTLVRGTTAVVLDIAAFLVTGAALVYASLEL